MAVGRGGGENEFKTKGETWRETDFPDVISALPVSPKGWGLEFNAHWGTEDKA